MNLEPNESRCVTVIMEMCNDFSIYVTAYVVSLGNDSVVIPLTGSVKTLLFFRGNGKGWIAQVSKANEITPFDPVEEVIRAKLSFCGRCLLL